MATSEKELTCEQRIRGYYAGRIETIGAMVKASTVDDLDELTDAELSEAVNEMEPDREAWTLDKVREYAETAIDEMPLAVELVRSVKITLGTGGPGDWFECRIDDEGNIDAIAYHFNDWFDHAQIDVTGDEDARAFCERFTEIMANGG